MLCVFGAAQPEAFDQAPVPIERARPQYPFDLRKANITGQVIVEFIVTTKGDVVNAFALRFTHPGFAPAAVAAVLKWKFKPGIKNGRPVNTRLQVPIVFTLNDVTDPHILHPLSEDSLKKLSPDMQYDIPPQSQVIEPGFYPYEALLENEREALYGSVLVSAQGAVKAIVWKTKTPPDALKEAAMAMLDTAYLKPAIKEDKAVATIMWFRINFDPSSGDVRISDSAAAILKQLRLEGDDAAFTKSTELDSKIKRLEQRAPRFPRLAKVDVDHGDALIELFIDQEGHAQLPRIITSSEPAFGYSACQAIASWRFEPPLKDGKPVVVKVRVPVEFKRE